LIAVAIVISGLIARAESIAMAAAPPGVVDAGAPAFVVFGAESLGLSTPPTDLHLLPDGRILVVSQREIAIGDGGRWETFQQAADQSGFISGQVAVDDDGQIYAGITGAIARIDLGENARWRFVPVVSVSHNDPFLHVIQFPDTWFWSSGGGAILAWRPGQPVRSAGELGTNIEHIFSFGQELYASTEASGSLKRLRIGGAPTLVTSDSALASDTVMSSTAFGPGQVLVGTGSAGLRVFDGRSLSDIAVPKILGAGQRINALCPVGSGLYAAAVDMVGIVFFDRDERIVQVLNRLLDHRLARASRLVYSSNGTLWALLDNAVACVRFPSPISNFEPIFASALHYAVPVRHEGQLWVLADGRLMRGVYSTDRILERFELDSPPGRFLWAISETGGRLFASNEESIFVRDGTGWKQIATGITNARIGIGRAQSAGQFFYVARGEIGWIQESAGQYAVRRIPVNGLGEVYNAVDDSTGAVWLELGSSRVGRVEFGAGEPSVRFFGKDDGLGEGWVSTLVIDGLIRCFAERHLLGFDARTQRFSEDKELTRRIPALVNSTGRPARDASGRLWFSFRGDACFVDDAKAGENPPVGKLALGFEPTDFNMESGGIIWMHGRGHLIRYDPRLPSPAPSPVFAKITSVELTARNHHLFNPGPALPSLPYSDNSLLIRFAAVSNPFGPPLSFDIMLEGATDRWVSTGTVGSASFNRLKEGSYVFHVRPVIGGEPGKEARLAFTVQPPWFRTKLAWVIYVLAAIGLVSSVAWLFSYLERREKIRLAHLVAERTAELKATNAQLGRQVEEITEKTAALAASEERYRGLNAELEHRVADRTAELSRSNVDLKREIAERQRAEQEVERVHKQLLTASHEAGMAEVATGVLHNVGNVLNSVNVAAGLVAERLRSSKITSVTRLARLLKEQGDGLARFFIEDARGRTVPAYLDQLAVHLEQERLEIGKELSGLILNVDHIKEIVAMQQNYARVSGVIENVVLENLVEDAIKIHGGAYARHGITLERDFARLPPIFVDKHKVLQILVNLIHNSKYACDATNLPTKRVTIRIRAGSPEGAIIEVTDTGVGIPPENLPRIFSQGFTTRKSGHGFGLHSAALAAKELGGTLTVHSDGTGLGATFALTLPLQPPASGEKKI
jgi:signal transduction histidine kinase